jgi:hypothetical protein
VVAPNANTCEHVSRATDHNTTEGVLILRGSRQNAAVAKGNHCPLLKTLYRMRLSGRCENILVEAAARPTSLISGDRDDWGRALHAGIGD